jgi:O-antigen ligase
VTIISVAILLFVFAKREIGQKVVLACSFFVPLASYLIGERSIKIGDISVVEGVAPVFFVFLALLVSGDKILQILRRFMVGFVVFGVYATLSLSVTPDKLKGVVLLVEILYPFLILALAYACTRTQGDAKLIANILLALNVIVIVLDLFNIILGQRFRDDAPFTYYNSVVGDRTRGAYFYSFMALFSLVHLLPGKASSPPEEASGVQGLRGLRGFEGLKQRDSARSSWRTTRFAALLVINLAVVVFQASRTPLIAFIAGSFVFWLLGPRPRSLFYPFAIVVGVILLITVLPTREEFISGEGINLGLSGRQEFWPVLFNAGLESPIVGHGIGSSSAILDTLMFFSIPIGTPHSEYLRLFYELGLVGVILFLIANAQLAYRIVLSIDKLSGMSKWYAVGGLAFSGGFLVSMLSDGTFWYYLIFSQFGFAMIGVTLKLSDLQGRQTPLSQVQ